MEFNKEQINALILWLEDANENGITIPDLISALRDTSEGFPIETECLSDVP